MSVVFGPYRIIFFSGITQRPVLQEKGPPRRAGVLQQNFRLNNEKYRPFSEFRKYSENSRLNKSDVKIGEDERFLIGTTVFWTILCFVLRQPAY